MYSWVFFVVKRRSQTRGMFVVLTREPEAVDVGVLMRNNAVQYSSSHSSVDTSPGAFRHFDFDRLSDRNIGSRNYGSLQSQDAFDTTVKYIYFTKKKSKNRATHADGTTGVKRHHVLHVQNRQVLTGTNLFYSPS